MTLPIGGILETALYAEDLVAAKDFYSDVLGLETIAEVEGRHVFFRCGKGVLLVFNPEATAGEATGSLPVPAHGAHGPGHACFSVAGEDLDRIVGALGRAGVAIEADFQWPNGARSIYFRDPAGNSVECAEPRLWAL